MLIFAIDPGSERSAFVVWDEEKIYNEGILPNDQLLSCLKTFSQIKPQAILVVEQVQSFGMAVGETVFETVFWSGRFVEAWGGEAMRVKRGKIKMHFCNSMQAKDCNVRQALIDRFGLPPTKKRPNPVYGGFKISKDCWQAWALAVFTSDTRKEIENERNL